MSEISHEEALIQSLIHGDDKAFSEIYYLYWEDLYRVVYKITQSNENSQDILQDFFIKLWQRRESLTISNSLTGYLLTSIRNETLTYLTKHAKRLKFFDSIEMHPQVQENSNSIFHSGLEYYQLKEKIQLELSKMPQHIQDIYLLSQEENFSNQEIANQLGISNQTVRNKIYFAKKTLRILLNDFLILIFIWILIK